MYFFAGFIAIMMVMTFLVGSGGAFLGISSTVAVRVGALLHLCSESADLPWRELLRS